jgi:hypothetical protein
LLLVLHLSDLFPELFEPPALVCELLPLPLDQQAQVVGVVASAEADAEQQHEHGQRRGPRSP